MTERDEVLSGLETSQRECFDQGMFSVAAEMNALVAQLDRAGNFYFQGCRFESCRAHQIRTHALCSHQHITKENERG